MKKIQIQLDEKQANLLLNHFWADLHYGVGGSFGDGNNFKTGQKNSMKEWNEGLDVAKIIATSLGIEMCSIQLSKNQLKVGDYK